MTGEEQELLEQYLTHLNVLGDEGSYPGFEAWYQEVRYAQRPGGPDDAGGGRRAALQGRPQRCPSLQPAAGKRQVIDQGLTPRRRRPAPPGGVSGVRVETVPQAEMTANPFCREASPPLQQLRPTPEEVGDNYPN